MKRLLALCGLFPLVYTRDFDGEVRLKIARHGWPGDPFTPPFTGWWCYTYLFENRAILNSDGSTSGAVYVTQWKEWPHNVKHVTPGAANGSDGAQEHPAGGTK